MPVPVAQVVTPGARCQAQEAVVATLVARQAAWEVGRVERVWRRVARVGAGGCQTRDGWVEGEVEEFEVRMASVGRRRAQEQVVVGGGFGAGTQMWRLRPGHGRVGGGTAAGVQRRGVGLVKWG